MNFTLKPDDNGIVVVLSNVDEADTSALESANKNGFDPTEAPFDKYYDYDRRIGFFVNKDHFDHAEHKGKRLSYGDYMALTAEDVVQAKDSAYSIDLICDKIAEIKMPKTVEHAISALSAVSFALRELQNTVDASDEKHKQAYHKAIDHAFDIQAKANEILAASNLAALLQLRDRITQFNDMSAGLQSKLLQKYNENF